MSNITCFKPTSENWCPNYIIDSSMANKNGYVHVGLVMLADNSWIVWVWGADDIGMEYHNTDPELVKEKYIKIVMLADVTRKALADIGLISA